MYDYFLQPLMGILSWSGITLLALGTCLGFLFGVLPGLGGAQVLALLLPLTFSMEPTQAIIVLIGAAGAVPTAGALTSILINTPGTSQNAATILDGYPLSKQGKASFAIGAATGASVMGAIVGVGLLCMILPIAPKVVLSFSYPEFFMLAVLGLAMLIGVAGGAYWKTMISAAFGLVLAAIGYDTLTGNQRYTFGIEYLYDGLRLTSVIIGIFAIAEAVVLITKKGTISSDKVNTSFSSMLEGYKAVFKHFGLFIRSSILGTIIGIVPGVGGTVANYMAYGHAVSSAKDKSQFGKGDIRGVIAPEASNNAKDGGELVPTLVFGIPGSVESAVLIGALILHGIQPGPRLVYDNPEIPLTMIYSLVMSNILAAILVFFVARYMVRVTQVKSIYLGPIVLMLALIGAYATNFMIEDMMVALLFGILGYFMVRYDFSRVSFVIAFVLGNILEKNYFRTIEGAIGPTGFFVRPISLTLLVLSILILLMPFIKRVREGGKRV